MPPAVSLSSAASPLVGRSSSLAIRSRRNAADDARAFPKRGEPDRRYALVRRVAVAMPPPSALLHQAALHPAICRPRFQPRHRRAAEAQRQATATRPEAPARLRARPGLPPDGGS
ncbi:MAG: hypothetical protein CFK52_12425 [Chloracidobacterium sp. CP2_5A]|nr:MAG: hypothetical protein CFK52_12425 [Chloracidobacterium sp. CP2_5A]